MKDIIKELMAKPEYKDVLGVHVDKYGGSITLLLEEQNFKTYITFRKELADRLGIVIDDNYAGTFLTKKHQVQFRNKERFGGVYVERR